MPVNPIIHYRCIIHLKGRDYWQPSILNAQTKMYFVTNV